MRPGAEQAEPVLAICNDHVRLEQPRADRILVAAEMRERMQAQSGCARSVEHTVHHARRVLAVRHQHTPFDVVTIYVEVPYWQASLEAEAHEVVRYRSIRRSRSLRRSERHHRAIA